ncbi:hypothetical protein HELRODRAFT_101329 [Helobdella robusta]|uniref:Cleavage and polyadenylation specificity factor subunit 3 n=1 Tax=Helobdella robusta TaxID=6412 RepID=T1ED40_HELRO|nr:hypothetical protein HELRODRAFT_101329 [Helobdella robusta]ESO00097.1 hypothetical protein HELRODRAFT_101329 [Helobdella robusta]
MAAKKKSALPIEDSDQLVIRPLGAGQEVGRSCLLLEFKGKKILLDCGIHPGMNGLDALPYFDLIQDELQNVNLMLISHFHLDHCGALPWFLQKTPFKGRCFMTHATKAIYRWLLSDYVKVSNISADKMLYVEKDIEESMDKIETVNFHQEIDISGIKFWCYNAGHVLGAAMFMIEIAGVKVLYTGDFSRQEDRHLMAAELPNVKPDVLIVESTYGTHIHEPREEREQRFTNLIHNIVSRGGRCLIPVFALGRAQELLLILDEYWSAHPELQEVPIYYASSLAKKCMSVYQTYIHAMNERIKKQIAVSNPFIFKHISNLKNADHFEDIGPSVVLASPGMMQSGLSRELFESWCNDKKNGVIIAGYCVEGTLAKHILSEPEEIVTMNGQKLPLRCSVDYISFSAHTDYQQTSEFIRILKPAHCVLVHGEQNEMSRLKAALIREYEDSTDYKINVHNPRNGQAVELLFRGEKLAKIVGQLAVQKPKQDEKISGVLVKKNFNYHIMHPSDIPNYTDLITCNVQQRLSVPYNGSLAQLQYHLNKIATDIELIKREATILVFKSILVTLEKKMAVLEWTSSMTNDMFADTIIMVILKAESDSAIQKLAIECTEADIESKENKFSRKAVQLMIDMFGEECKPTIEPEETLTMTVDDCPVSIHLKTLNVKCSNDLLHQMITTAVTKLNHVLTAC